MESKIYEIVTFVTIVSMHFTVSQTVSDKIEPTKSSIFISTSSELEAVMSLETYNISDTYGLTSSDLSTIPSSMVSSSVKVISTEINNQTWSSTEMFSTITDSTTKYSTDITSTQTINSVSSFSSASSSPFSSYSEPYSSSVVESTSVSASVSKISVSTINSATNVISTSEVISTASYQSSSVSYSSVTHSSVTHSSTTHFSTTTLPATSTNFVPRSVGLSTGGKVAVGILVVVCGIVIVTVGVYCFKKRRKFGSFNVPYKRWTSYGTPDDEIHLSFNEERL